MKKLAVLLIATLSVAIETQNQWEGYYVVSQQSQIAAIGHKPTRVCLVTEKGSTMCGKSLYLASDFGGFSFSKSPLILSADMSQEEFDQGLLNANLVILDKEIAPKEEGATQPA